MRDTVLILGAGVSHEYKYPSGIQLLKSLKETINARRSSVPNATKILEALIALNPYSIDYFISKRPEFADALKPLIVDIIFSRESATGFIVHDKAGNEIESIYKKLFNSINPNQYSNLKIISFNYDRSFEFYFISALMALFNMSEQNAWIKLSEIEIEHVYGRLPSLGSGIESEYYLNNIDQLYLGKFIPYGGNSDTRRGVYRNILDEYAVQSIFTVYEDNHSIRPNFSEKQRKIRKTLEISQRIFFLGFGYHDLNMEILGFKPISQCKKENTFDVNQLEALQLSFDQKFIAGTALGMGGGRA